MIQILQHTIRKSDNIYILLFNNHDIINIHNHKINISKSLTIQLIHNTNQILAIIKRGDTY